MMPTFAPVVLSGNSPHLPDDTRSRCIRILLMPDINGVAEDSDWEEIEPEAKALHHNIVVFADSVREVVEALKVTLPPDCTGRAREKWRPLKRIAQVAGGEWPSICDRLIARGLAEDEADRMDGLQLMPPAVLVMHDLRKVWGDTSEAFLGTRELVNRLVYLNPEQWSQFSVYGKRLTETRLGRMITQVAKVHSTRLEHNGVRGYLRADLALAWKRLGIRENSR
jgi:Protein of unknown function (DUF3631)